VWSVSDGGDAYGATVDKRHLSRALTELRTATKMTANHICDRLTWGRGKVGRFEANVWSRPELSDVRDLLRAYHASPETCAEIEALAVSARRRAWWRNSFYKGVFDDEFPGYESDAKVIRTCMPLILPGLLQTEAYIRAQMRVGTKDPDWCERALAGRLRRQAILDREGTAPDLVAIITEASLRYRWGDLAEQRDQIEHLIKAARRPNVELRVLRFDDGPHPGMNSLVNGFTFADPAEPPMVYLETDTSMREVSQQEANDYLVLFERIRDKATPAADTIAFLSSLTEQLELT
jgi:hypothetical protein